MDKRPRDSSLLHSLTLNKKQPSILSSPSNNQRDLHKGMRSLSRGDDRKSNMSVNSRNRENWEEKISHFVEVGFQLDRNNFKMLLSYDERTYDS